MRASSFSALVATALVAAAISACSGIVQVTPTCDGGACATNPDGGDGGQGKEGDSCFSDGDCASPTRCMFPQPSEESPAGTACGSRGTCQQQFACGIACPAPAQYMGCDCAGHSVNACQCPSNGYGPQTYSVVFGAPTTALDCPNDPPPTKKDGGPPGLDAGDGGNDLNVTGSLTVDGQKCSLTSSSRQTQSAPDGHTWTIDIGATCPGALGQVLLFVTGKDNVLYPYGCDTTAGMQLSVGGEGDAGFLAYSGGNAGGSCSVADGPIVSDQPNKIRGTGTLSNGAGKSHTVDLFEP